MSKGDVTSMPNTLKAEGPGAPVLEDGKVQPGQAAWAIEKARGGWAVRFTPVAATSFDLLRDAGMEVEELGDDHIMIPGYCVPVGKFERLKVDVGIAVPPDFPLSPPSGPHVHKLIHANRPDGPHPYGHIHASAGHSKHFGDGWQYWSRPHPNWASGAKNAIRYMEHVRALWESQ